MNKSFITIRPVLVFVKERKQHTQINFKKRNNVMGNLNVLKLHQLEAKNQLIVTLIPESG